jgi:hypothetical protein
LDEFTHYNLEPTVFGMFGAVSNMKGTNIRVVPTNMSKIMEDDKITLVLVAIPTMFLTISSSFGILTPKGPRLFFFKKYLKSAISSLRNPNELFLLSCAFNVGSCPRLLGKHVQKVSKKLTA